MFEDAIGLKKKIREGKQVVGYGVPFTVTREQLESLRDSGPCDYLSIDAQHSAFNEETVAEFCAMAEELDLFVQFRIKHTRLAFLSGNYLDLGPCGVEIPQTELDATVDEALSAFYYPQVGMRSYGGRGRRASQGKTPEEYAEWWNRYGVLWMQIESVEAVSYARQFAKPGVDVLSFGPIDLTFSLQAHPHHPFQSVDDCVAYVVRALEGSPTKVCFRNYDPKTRQKYADMGVTVFLESPKF